MNADDAEYCGEVRAAVPQNDDERRKFWAEKVKKERNRRDLISNLIEAEFRRVNKGVEITDGIREELNFGSRKAHEVLYGCCHVLVVMPDRGDKAWTIPGTIRCWDTKGGLLEVELQTWGYFCSNYDWLQYVKPEHLDHVTYKEDSGERDEEYTVSFGFRRGIKYFRFQFDLQKSCIDELEAIRSKSDALMAIMEVKVASPRCPNTKQDEAVTSVMESQQKIDAPASPAYSPSLSIGQATSPAYSPESPPYSSTRPVFPTSPIWSPAGPTSPDEHRRKVNSETDQSSCAEICLHGFPSSQELSVVEPFLKLFWNKFVEKEDDDLALEQRFQVAIDITCIRYWSIWGKCNDLHVIISILLHNGTQDTRKGILPNARAIAAVTCFFEQWIAIFSDSQCDWYFAKIHELFNADEHTLVNYFRNRIPCSCLDDKHKEVRPIIKMGICCNPQCSLPDRKLERAAMESCEQCRLAHYCSRHCQKKDWKRHKDACLHVSSKVNVRNAQLAQAQSAYDEAFRSSARLQAQLHQMKINMSADSTIDQSTKSGEAGVTQAQTEQRRTAEIKRLENELNMSEARRGQAWKALNLLKTPQVDYSKTLSYEVVDSGIRIY